MISEGYYAVVMWIGINLHYYNSDSDYNYALWSLVAKPDAIKIGIANALNVAL